MSNPVLDYQAGGAARPAATDWRLLIRRALLWWAVGGGILIVAMIARQMFGGVFESILFWQVSEAVCAFGWLAIVPLVAIRARSWRLVAILLPGCLVGAGMSPVASRMQLQMFLGGYALLLVTAQALWPNRKARLILVWVVFIAMAVCSVLLLLAMAMGGFGVIH